MGDAGSTSLALRTRWGFLRILHPLFLATESLPTVELVDQGYYGSALEDVDHLKNEITTLRNDFKLNIIKQQLIDVDQLTDDDPSVDSLASALQILLEELEQLIDGKVLDFEFEWTSEAEPLASLPRLLALRKLLQGKENPTTDDLPGGVVDDSNEAISQTNTFSVQRESSWNKRYSAASITQVASFIRFPQDPVQIESCRRTVSHFGMAIDRALDDSAGPWAIESQMPEYTPQDVEAIQHAHDFASSCTSLFSLMAGGNKCGASHVAKLHLSGFKKDQLQMNLETCQEMGWISAVFERSSGQPSSELFYFDDICSTPPPNPKGSEVLHVAFNSDGMWTPSHGSSIGPPVPVDDEKPLYDLLGRRDGLTPKFRKLAGVLLAASMFQLSDSPWIEQHLESESIIIPSPDNKRLQQWCPRVICTLMARENTRLQSDMIAAFGVLILELEANNKAEWVPGDEDWISGERSNHVRLARILKSWEDIINDDHRRVAKACLEFDSLLESLDYPDNILDRRGLAFIYKFILEPLFRHVMKSFGILAPLFNGMFGPGRSIAAPMSISAPRTAKRVLFDDDVGLPKREDQSSASSFANSLEPLFTMIKNLRSGLVNLTSQPTHENIRIAVLDSGVDDTDSIIRPAIRFGRINAQQSRSFVGGLSEWRQDTHGHGTHVAQLLLRTAPVSEIFVGKICTGKVINDEFMPGIAKAIDWAVKECDAHIISLSFGFEDEHDLIETAIDNALDAGKLIIAAASNNGGLYGRARPARQDDVLCIHATDGKGNKGGMNPTPMVNKDNFATLGVAVPCKWKGKEVWKSGTSFAVPIAVGFAANILEFAKYKCNNLRPRKVKMLYQKRGMQEIFRKMAEERDGYDFIHPVRLWGDYQDSRIDQAAGIIEDIMGSL